MLQPDVPLCVQRAFPAPLPQPGLDCWIADPLKTSSVGQESSAPCVLFHMEHVTRTVAAMIILYNWIKLGLTHA